MAEPALQKRSRAIAMTTEERDAFLAAEVVARIATVQADGSPHVTPIWFAWDGGAMWFYSIIRSQRWTNLVRDPRVSVVVDAGGAEYFQLRGVEMLGNAELVGEQPRLGTPDAALELPERLFAQRYLGGTEMSSHDGRHAWVRLVPRKIVTWDFRKLSGTETITNPAR